MIDLNVDTRKGRGYVRVQLSDKRRSERMSHNGGAQGQDAGWRLNSELPVHDIAESRIDLALRKVWPICGLSECLERELLNPCEVPRCDFSQPVMPFGLAE